MATTEDKRVLVDTNVLLAATDTSRERHSAARDFLDRGLAGEYRLFVVGQIFREYLVVATRPIRSNGFGLPVHDAISNLQRFQQFVQVLPEDAETVMQLVSLIREYDLKGKRIHDANLVASMTRHGLRKLKTFNSEDFKVFAEIDII